MASTINRLAGAALAPEIVVPVAHGYNPGRMIADDPLAADAQAVHGLLHFGPFELDLQQRTLTAGGTPVRLDGKTFDLLEMLVLHCGETLTKADIIRTVWRGRAVSDKNVDVQMSALRRALAEHSGGAAFIKTLPDQRYRFVAEVQRPSPTLIREAPGPRIEIRAAAAVLSRKTRRAIAAVATVMALGLVAWALARWGPLANGQFEIRRSIAVLPFRNMGPDTSDGYLADAVTDDLMTDLARIPGMTVIARESAVAIERKALPAQEMGRLLQVRYILSGDTLNEGGTSHITTRLVDAATGAQLWAESFDTARGKMTESRDAIVRRIATSLGFALEHLESARSLRDRPDDPDALDYFFRARAILDWDDSSTGLETAQTWLEKAVTKQPDFADARAELGWLLLRKIQGTVDPNDAADYARAKDMITKALQLSPRNVKALAARGRELSSEGKCGDAIYDAEAALELQPSSIDAETVLADCAQSQGHLDDAITHFRVILRLNPDSPTDRPRYLALGQEMLFQRRIPEAIDFIKRSITGDGDLIPGADEMGRQEFAQIFLIAAYQIGGDTERAAALYKAYAKIWPNRSSWRLAAYYTKGLAALSGFQNMITALEQAGMPRYARPLDQNMRAGGECAPGDFSETPSVLKGGKIIDTAALVTDQSLKLSPLVVDVGRGTAAIPNAVWYDFYISLDSSQVFIDMVAHKLAGPGKSAPMVIVGDGIFGCDAYLGAARLITEGYTQISWYRGGEEAWSASGNRYEDHRPQ